MKKEIIRILSLLLVCCLFVSAAGCAKEPDGQQGDTADTVREPLLIEGDGTATLVTAFSLDGLTTHKLPYTDDLTCDKLAQGLIDLTWLNFDVAFTYWSGDDGSLNVTIDWAPESTLVQNLGDQPQNEDFFFYDYSSLAAFMMDSLYQTLLANFNVDYVFYTMDGGRPLVLKDLSPDVVIAPDTPFTSAALLGL